MNRVLKGFIIAPITLGLLMSIYNISFEGIKSDLSVLIFGTVLYSFFAYFFTLLLALPSYFIVKKIYGDRKITYLTTSICGATLGLTVDAFLMSGEIHGIPLLLFGLLGLVLSTLFWYIALK